MIWNLYYMNKDIFIVLFLCVCFQETHLIHVNNTMMQEAISIFPIVSGIFTFYINKPIDKHISVNMIMLRLTCKIQFTDNCVFHNVFKSF